MAIYIFCDVGYEIGVKVGRGDPSRCIAEAQGYSPRGIECVAYWDVSVERESALEKVIHSSLGQRFGTLRLPTEDNPRNGKEWFRATPVQSIKLVRSELKDDPRSTGLKCSRVFDKLRSEPHYKGRLVLWVVKEFETGAIKLYQCSEWSSPREMRRRYSRNGFAQVAALVYRSKPSPAANESMDSLRKSCLDRFPTPTGRKEYGWFESSVDRSDVEAFLKDNSRNHGLELESVIDISTAAGRPPGVRVSYHASGGVPHSELPSFERIWWQ
jgi:hypothetical protein